MLKLILRFVLRVFCLPMLVVLSVLCVMFDMALRLFCWAASLLYWFLFICMLIAVCNSQWINIGILSAMFVGLVILTLLVGLVGAVIEIVRDSVKGLYAM